MTYTYAMSFISGNQRALEDSKFNSVICKSMHTCRCEAYGVPCTRLCSSKTCEETQKPPTVGCQPIHVLGSWMLALRNNAMNVVHQPSLHFSSPFGGQIPLQQPF